MADKNYGSKKALSPGSGLRPSERTPTEPPMRKKASISFVAGQASPKEKAQNVLRKMATEKKKKNWGMGKDERSRTRPGQKDYTGHKGDKSKTDKGSKDYMSPAAMKKSMKDQGDSIEAQIRESSLSPAAKRQLIRQLRAK